MIQMTFDDLGFSAKPIFSIGENLILTLNGSDKIYLKPSIWLSMGKHSSLKNATFDHSVYLEKEVLDKLINADSINFDLQGSQSSVIREVIGVFSPQNIDNIRKLRSL